MQVIDRGSGTPLVIVPGIQGRWEWMRPAVDALAERHRVVTFSLCDEPTSGFRCDPARGVENYLDQLDAVFEQTGLEDAVLVGVSYGGPIAAEYTLRRPERVRTLVLVNALPTDWQADTRARFYMRAPRLFSPVFFFDAPLRAWPELRASLPRLTQRAQFGLAQTGRLLRYFMSPSRMARRIAWLKGFRFGDCTTVRRPVVVITGEPGLDRVVRPELTRRYLDMIPHARYAVLPRTGHLGVVTRPRQFAALLHSMLNGASSDARASA